MPRERADVSLPLHIRTRVGVLSLITTFTTFGTPLAVTVSDLAIELLFPADPETERGTTAARRSTTAGDDDRPPTRSLDRRARRVRAFAVFEGGLTRAMGLASLVPWVPMLVWLTIWIGSFEAHGLALGYAALLASTTTVCLAFDVYDLWRWVRAEREIRSGSTTVTPRAGVDRITPSVQPRIGSRQEIVKQGLVQGHDITALVRDASQILLTDTHLHLVVGDILNTQDVDAAMAGQDAVICSLGTGVTFKHVTLFSDGTLHLLDAMRKHAVRRIVCITGIGAGDSRGHGGFFYDRVVGPTLLHTIYQDKDRQEELLRHSDRDWVIVRPGMLTNDAAIGKYRVLLDLTGITAGKIARADVAAFVLQQLTSDDFLRKTPLLTY